LLVLGKAAAKNMGELAIKPKKRLELWDLISITIYSLAYFIIFKRIISALEALYRR
jgi:hypothetical protein